MRPEFKKNVEQYNELAKDMLDVEGKEPSSEEVNDKEMSRLETVLEWHTDKNAEKRGTKKDVQETVFDIQKEKQRIMRGLRRDLRALDTEIMPEKEPQPGDRMVKFDGEGLYWEDDDGERYSMTLGEAVTDLTWGITYHMDADSVPRSVKKRYLVEHAKFCLQEMLDTQIATEEISSGWTDTRRQDAYAASEERKGRENLPSGIIAEKLVEQFLRKMVIDKDLPYTIHHADIYQDVAQKIDFIIRKVDHGRGVRVEGGAKAQETLGLQVTLNDAALEKKKRQIEKSKERLTEEDRIDDIVLVHLDLGQVQKLFNDWVGGGKMAGGPDQLLDEKTRQGLFLTLLKGMDKEKQLRSQWKKANKVAK